MNIMIFGATGMVGQGVLRACLQASDVGLILSVGRSASEVQNAKLRDLVRPDLLNFFANQTDQNIASELSGYDACFFCLGVSSGGMDEVRYTQLTYDLTLSAAELLARLNPQMTFIYVSGTGTDSSEQGRSMWARVKGRTENALMRLPFKAAVMFRPGVIVPLHGARSKTKSYRLLYTLTAPLLPVLRALFPKQVLTTESVANAMLNIARFGIEYFGLTKRGERGAVLEAADIYMVVNARKVSPLPTSTP